jgi:mannose-6-phosphate isomerase-like protein (cupin superfamily)
MTDVIDFARVFARLAAASSGEETTSIGGVNIRTVRVPGGGPGRWDSHAHTTETVVVWSGTFQVEFSDRTLLLSAGQCCVVPIATEHRGTSPTGAEVILFTQSAG